MDAIQYDAMMDMAMEAGMALTLAGASEGWYYSLWYASTDEEQEEMMAQWMEDIAEMAAKTEEARAAMAGGEEEGKGKGKGKEDEGEGEEEEGEGEGEEGEEGEGEEDGDK